MNTQKNDIVLSELKGANNQKIRLLSRRAVVVSKDFPFNERYYEEWFERFSTLYNKPHFSLGYVNQFSAARTNELMDKYDATMLVRTVELEENSMFRLIGTSEGEDGRAYIYRNTELVNP